MPQDRIIEGVDQLNFFLGKKKKSDREAVAVDHEISRGAIRRRVHGLNRISQAVAGRQPAIGPDREVHNRDILVTACGPHS